MTGACESCPSSTTTMKMGIEKVLKEKFGDAVKDIRQVNEVQVNETTVEVYISSLIFKIQDQPVFPSSHLRILWCCRR